MLQCERLYHDIMKEASDKLGPGHALTTEVTSCFFLSAFCVMHFVLFF